MPRTARLDAPGAFHHLMIRGIERRNRRDPDRIWRNRFFSCIVDRESYLWSVARYIGRNPVRAQMVTDAAVYRWSSAGDRAAGQISTFLGQGRTAQPQHRTDFEVPWPMKNSDVRMGPPISMNLDPVRQTTFFLLLIAFELLFLQAGGMKLFAWAGGQPAARAPRPIRSPTS